MEFEKVGRNIRRLRVEKNMRQEDLAEKAGLSEKYIGMVERGEKTPSLETFIGIINALDASADAVLSDILHTGYHVKSSLLAEKLERLSFEDRARIFDVVETLIRHSPSASE